jgi:hypothetical protein
MLSGGTQMSLHACNIERPTSNAQRSIKKLPAEGLEPTRSCDHWILSPARLPIPPRRHFTLKSLFHLWEICLFLVIHCSTENTHSNA